MKRVKNYIKDLISIFSRYNPYSKLSYSQCGEDLIVQYIFRLRGISKPSYLDIGANHPYFLSNTALFYEKGSKGITVEANPKLSKLYKIHRPKNIHLNVGVSNQEGEMDFYIMKDDTLSTFSIEEVNEMKAFGKTLDEIKKVRLTTITKIINENNNNLFPDFLNVDVEGLDLQILKSIDYEKSFPKVICVESANYSPIGAGSKKLDIVTFLNSKGYYEYANTNLNSIMVKNEFWFF